MIKKIIVILVILAGSLFYLCKSSSDSDIIKLQFTSWGSKSEVDIIKPLLDKFEANNPDIKIEFMHIPQNYFQKIHLLFASNTAPDVIFINNHYLPLYAGVLEPLEFDNAFYPKALEALSWKNVLYAVPRDISNLVIFYNKDIFDRKNIPYPSADWDLEQFLDIAKKLTGDGIYGISFEEDALFYLPYLMSEGGGILSDDLSEIIVDEPASQKGLQFYADLRKKYHVAPLKEEIASATSAQMFLQGKLAMHLSGRWLVPKYREEADFDWDVISFPKGDFGSIVPLDASGWAISKKSKHKKEAKMLIDYLSSKESIAEFTKSGLIVTARIDAARYFLDDKKPNNAKIFFDVIETSKPTPVSVNYREILDDLHVKFEKLFN